MTITLRQLTVEDMDWAAGVLAATGLSARQPELRRYLALEPAGHYAAEVNGRQVGLGGFLAYGSFAFIGNMAVAPEWQGRGVGRAVLARLIDDIERRGSATIVLEATPEGEPLYRKFGFAAEHPTLAYTRLGAGGAPPFAGPDPAVGPLSPAELDEVAAFDRPRFGGARPHVLARFLEDFPRRAFVARRGGGAMAGYLIAQARVLGPWLAEDGDAAEALLATALALPFDGPPAAFTPEPNRVAAALLGRFGFTVQPESLRMRRGEGLVDRPECLYGLAALAIG
jgi:predicted N-acetyltransferase YhbS